MGLIKNEGHTISWLEGYGFKYNKRPVAGDGTPDMREDIIIQMVLSFYG